MPTFTVKYYAGTYKGTKTVQADDDEHAIAKVRAWVRGQMTEPMYADGYQVIDQKDEDPAAEKRR